MSGVPTTPAILHLTKFIDICRVNLFDTVTQYRAIFPATGSTDSRRRQMSSGRDLYDNRSHGVTAGGANVSHEDDGDRDPDDADHEADFSDCKILTSWFLHKIDACLQVMTNDLVSCIESEPFFPIDSIIDPCFYFGLSLTRIGADIRPRLLLIFNNIFLRRFGRVLGRASKAFLESLTQYQVPAEGLTAFPDSCHQDSQNMRQTPSDRQAATAMTAQTANPPLVLLQFEPLAVFLNGIISGLNEIRSHASIMNVCKMRDALNDSLARATNGILSYCR